MPEPASPSESPTGLDLFGLVMGAGITSVRALSLYSAAPRDSHEAVDIALAAIRQELLGAAIPVTPTDDP